MFDNLREDANSSPYFEDRAKLQPAEGTTVDRVARKSSKFLGMTPVQRFVISVMFLIVVCNLGLMFLLITGRIGLF